MTSIELNEQRFLDLLTKLIGETEHLQNNPPEHVPKEDLAIKHVLDVLTPHSTAHDGPLTVKKINYVQDRGNLIITYPAATNTTRTVSFVGSHLDVVPAVKGLWKVEPFKLSREDDYLYGRGTTDCLGHVALLTDFFAQLAEKRPQLSVTVVAVFIASEEHPTEGVGVEELVKRHELDFLKGGPVYWVDSADSQPCIGTAASIDWKLTVTGHLFHSGLPDKAINPLELGFEAFHVMQDRFYKDFPATPEEQTYHFINPSTFKPTQISTSAGSINQIPAECYISGDIRLTPFYKVEDAKAKLQSYVKDLNESITSLPSRGPSKYVLPDGTRGKLELKFSDEVMPGIACNLDSEGFKAIDTATREVLGESKPYSIGGSLPLVKDLQNEGFDIQITGYGKQSVYHGDNEYCLLSDMKNAAKILSKIVDKLNTT